jgi:hypothetical protein
MFVFIACAVFFFSCMFSGKKRQKSRFSEAKGVVFQAARRVPHAPGGFASPGAPAWNACGVRERKRVYPVYFAALKRCKAMARLRQKRGIV